MNWWESFYDENLSMMLLRGKDDAQEKRTVDFLNEKLKLKKGDLLFDQCCGEGRLSKALLKKGFDVVGVDQCAAYVDVANGDQVEKRFFQGDAFEYTTPTLVDAAFNWWTSFGYSDKDSQNIKMIEAAYTSLKVGGRFALDFLNAPNILAEFKDEVRTERNDCLLIRRGEFDFHKGVFTTHWSYTLSDGNQVEHKSHVRMYMPVDLVDMFTKVGFVEIELFGDEDGSKLTRHSSRCIVVGKK